MAGMMLSDSTEDDDRHLENRRPAADQNELHVYTPDPSFVNGRRCTICWPFPRPSTHPIHVIRPDGSPNE